MTGSLKFALGFLLSVCASAEVHSVCLKDAVGLNPFNRKAFEAEFRELTGRDVIFAPADCPTPAVSLSIMAYPPARYTHALGLAYHDKDRVFPELRVYTKPVLRLLGEQASAAQLGRALARVAAHEFGHYFLQRLDHDHEGLMKDSFQGPDLGAEDPASFRLSKRSALYHNASISTGLP